MKEKHIIPHNYYIHSYHLLNIYVYLFQASLVFIHQQKLALKYPNILLTSVYDVV